MTEQPNLLQQINDEYGGASADPFKREEIRKVLRIKKIEVAFMPNAQLERSQVDVTHPDFRAAYPQGVPALHIVVEGVSVFYEPTNEMEHWVPIYGIRPEQWGSRLGRRSRIHVTTDAFVKTFGLKPFGTDNQKRLTGKVAVWGQHLGDAEIGGETREWAWDIPRQALPDDYQFDGTPTVIKLRSAEDGAAQAAQVATELSESDANAAVVEAIIGLKTSDEAEAAARVKDIVGITGTWVEAALEQRVMRTAYEKELISIDTDGETIVAAQPVEA